MGGCRVMHPPTSLRSTPRNGPLTFGPAEPRLLPGQRRPASEHALVQPGPLPRIARGPAGATGGGAVSRMNRSSAATTAAASSGDASGASIVELGAAVHHSGEGIVAAAVPEIPVLDHDAVLAAVSPERGDRRASATAFVRHHARRVGDAGEGLPRRARRTATSGRCPPAATASRCSSGSRRSRATPRTGCRR